VIVVILIELQRTIRGKKEQALYRLYVLDGKAGELAKELPVEDGRSGGNKEKKTGREDSYVPNREASANRERSIGERCWLGASSRVGAPDH
jgi:hypothetical protein